MSLSVEERFWAKVEMTPTCWLWTACVDTGGYGRFSVNQVRRSAFAHRWSYETLVGPVPDGLYLDHLCRVRSCVNPAHLEATTMRVNTLRGIGPTAINASKDRCLRGHPLVGSNLAVRRDGERRCRICQRERDREWRAAKRRAS